MQEFFIHKVKGQFQNTGLWKEHCDQLPDGRYVVRIKSTKQRSTDQNQYYWGVVVPMVYEGLREAGFNAVRSSEDAHEIMKSLFLKVSEEKGDIKIERVKSTTELTTVEFSEFLMNVCLWALDYLNITIPEPGQQLEFKIDG